MNFYWFVMIKAFLIQYCSFKYVFRVYHLGLDNLSWGLFPKKTADCPSPNAGDSIGPSTHGEPGSAYSGKQGVCEKWQTDTDTERVLYLNVISQSEH